MNNLNKWNSIWKFGTFEKKYPDKEIQDFEKFHLPKKNKKNFKILDIGFGNGVHINFLSKKGYSCYGLETSDFIIRRFRNKKKFIVKKGNFIKLPFKDNFFNSIICNGVMYYDKKSNVKKGFQEIYKKLKIGGVARIYMLSTNNYKFKKKINYELNDWSIEKLKVNFFSLKECKLLTKKFTKVFFGTHEYNFINYKEKHSYWVLTCYK